MKAHSDHRDERNPSCALCFPEGLPDPPKESVNLPDLQKDSATDENEEKQEELEAEDYGPKTAVMPDSDDLNSGKIRELIDVGSIPDHLREKAWEMLQRRIKAFGFDGRLGHHLAKVHIRTVDGQVPIAIPMYRSTPSKCQVIDEQLDKWFEQGVIEPSITPWSAPVVIAYRNGKPRFCVDYRKLNAVTIPDEFPIPRQSEILSAISGAQVLSSQGILAPYLWIFCLVYIDNIVIFSRTYEEHLEHLELVLKAIESAGITLSPNKCHLFYNSILLLGHKVSRLGLSTHEEKVRAILELERPAKLSDLQGFLGMVVFSRPSFHFMQTSAGRCFSS